MEKLIITAAVNGGITSRVKNPNVPYTPEEIAQSVFECWSAGAAVVHIHARNDDGSPSYSEERYGEIVERIRARCDVIINLSTSGLNLPPDLPARYAWSHLKFKPDIVSFNCGSVNHGEKPFVNPPQLARELAQTIKAYRVRPEIEVYHGGIIGEAVRLAQSGHIDAPYYFCFALGIPGGLAATCKNLLHLTESLPDGSIWSAFAIGKHQLPINLHTILLGGHVRADFEDNVFYSKGELAVSNAQFIDRLVRYSREIGREIASPADARVMLSISSDADAKARASIPEIDARVLA